MINKRTLLGLVFLLLGFQTFHAQNTEPCSSDALNDTLLARDPVMYMGFMQFEQAVQSRMNTPVEERSNEIYSLPVVVHIIHKGEPYGSGSNITNEQIFSAITALNNDFRHVPGTNGYGSGPDIGIEFCMAVRDPNGQPTNGINRVDGRSVALYDEQGIAGTSGIGANEAAVKALSTWPRTSYVNIWVVAEIENNNGGSGVQGYAYFPTNSPLDGIVLLYNAFGTVGNLKSYTNLNRTLTHEMGHYLGLYHTFHSTTSCNPEGNCTTAGDRVCDTPVTVQNSSCSSPACSGTQQVENFMDYTNQACQNRFTEGQKLRMRTALEVQRASMLTSLGCIAVNDYDAAITAVLHPNGNVCAGNIQPIVTLSNFGNNPLTQVTIHYNLDGVGSNSINWTGSLEPGASTSVTLNSLTPAVGTRTLYVWTSSPNNQTDQNSTNDQFVRSFNVVPGGVATLYVRLDYYGSETTWRITDENNVLLMNGGPYSNFQQGTIHTHDICLPPGCYTLTFYDTGNDGQGFTNGNFRLMNAQGDTLAFRAGNWGQNSVNPFCLLPSNDAPVASLTISDNTVCKNASTNFTSTSTGQPTSYSWSFEGGTPAVSTAQNPQNITYSTVGVYDVTLTVTNAFGSNTYVCVDCITVNNLPSVALTGNNPSCNGASTGSINSSVTGGGASPVYAWSNGATTAHLNNVAAGSYTLTVTNNNGCTAQASHVLTNPAGMVVTGAVNNCTCSNSQNGSISVSVTGGVGTKTYSWSNSATGSSISGLAPGNYTVTVTDANDCIKTQTFTITAPQPIVINGTVNSPTCSGQSGSITVSATGGTGNKTFTWSNGATGSSISNLTAGTYTVTATDANDCTASHTFTVSAPSAMTINGVLSNPACAGGSNGVISVSVTGANGAVSYVWENGVTGNTLSNLSAGTYSVTATDAGGCSITQSFTITSPQPVSPNLTYVDITCSGTFGSAQVNPSGGMGNYQILWSNGQTTNSIQNLTAGEYSVTVKDVFNCSSQESFTISEVDGLMVTIQTNDISCTGANDGSLTAMAEGGSGSYSYLWNNNQTSDQISALGVGTYSVIVTDENGCQGMAQAQITQPTPLSIDAEILDVSCHGGSNGAIYASAQGGTAPYQYAWNNNQITSSITDLVASNYTLLITDARGCEVQSILTVDEPDILTANILVIQGESCAGNDAEVELIAEGGNGGYSVYWSNNVSGATLSGVAAGEYNVTVIDMEGCTIYASVEIPYDCQANIPITQLSTQSCGVENLPLNALLYCDPVANAAMYQWHFETEQGILVSEEFSLGNVFYASQIPNVDHGIKYHVRVKALVSGIWGQYGPMCVIGMEGEPEVILPVLNDSSCGVEIVAWGQTITSVPVPNVQTYQWRITGPDYDWTTYTTTNSLVIEEAMQLAPGFDYEVRIRGVLGQGSFTDWGPICVIRVNLAINVAAYPPVSGILHFYPNPCDGVKLIFDFGNLPQGSTVEDLVIYTATGKLVESMKGGLVNGNGNIYEYYFKNQLASGLYILRYKYEGVMSEEKLMVR